MNLAFLRRDQLQVIPLQDNYLWMDAGNADSLLAAAQAIHDLQHTTGQYVGCIEEVAYREGRITRQQLHQLGSQLDMTAYGRHLLAL